MYILFDPPPLSDWGLGGNRELTVSRRIEKRKALWEVERVRRDRGTEGERERGGECEQRASTCRRAVP